MTEPDRISANELFGDLTFVPLPPGTRAAAAFALFKLVVPEGPDGDDEEEWSVRVTGSEYSPTEFLGALVSYVHALTVNEAQGWLEDDDRPE
jgi:hypothetical protein